MVENTTRLFEIPEDEVTLVFQKYERGRKAREQKLEGSGIGLFLAERILQLHHGEVQLIRRQSPVRFSLLLKN